MTGWRVGFAVGNAAALASLAKVKANVDSGVFGAVQQTAAVALARIRSTGDHLADRVVPSPPRHSRRRTAPGRLVGGLAPGDLLRLGEMPEVNSLHDRRRTHPR